MNKNFLILLALSISFTSCNGTDKNYHVETNKPLNLEKHQDKSPLLLISIDGYRHDYTQKYGPKFLSNFAKQGTQVRSLIPSFPTKTFPNHLSIVTGRYPMNHGIVGNSFYAPDLKLKYSLRDSKAVTNGDFYKAMPVWGALEEQGMRTATLFWPGSEAEIMGQRPSYWLKYQHGLPHEDRINRVIEWLKLPKEKKPLFMTLYFSDVDSAGHKYGTESDELIEAISKVDQSIEKLISQAKELQPNINIIIVSDHGMKNTSEDKTEIILKTSELKNLEDQYMIIGKGPIVHFYEKEVIDHSKNLELINASAKNFKCYTKDKTPAQYDFNTTSRIGAFTCIAKNGYWLGSTGLRFPTATHGWEQYSDQDMHGILYMNGPSFKTNFIMDSKKNVHIFPLILETLGAENKYKIDGNLSEIENALK